MRYGAIPLTLIAFACFSGYVACRSGLIKPATPETLTTINYAAEPFRTFEIVGTDIKGIELKELREAISRHQKQHPGVAYELLAEVKCTPEQSNLIVAEIKGTGVTLRHYWAPVSCVDLKSTPGKYGRGHVDILSQI